VSLAAGDDAMPDRRPARAPRGWLSLYVAAFALLLTAGLFAALAARTFLEDLLLLKLSAACSLAAIVTAVLAVVLRRRS
jgi:hypothetical protein